MLPGIQLAYDNADGETLGARVAAQRCSPHLALCGDRWMRRLSAPSSRSGPAAELPPAVAALLIDVVADGFALYCRSDKAAPTALVASNEGDHRAGDLNIMPASQMVTPR